MSNKVKKPKITNKIHNIKSYGFSSPKELSPTKTSLNKFSFNFGNFPTYRHVDIEKKTHNSVNRHNNIVYNNSSKNYTIKNNNINNYKRNTNYTIVGDVTKIYSKVYNTKNDITFKSIFQKDSKIVLGNKTKPNENNTQKKYEKITNNQNNKVTYGYMDYPRNEITYKHPQIYVLNNDNKKNNNSIVYLPRINSNNLLNISRKTNFTELIPDYTNYYDNYNKEKFYEYYIKKRFGIKKFN